MRIENTFTRGVTHRLVDLLPELATSVASALREEGYAAVADSLHLQCVERCTYDGDGDVDAGYIYLVQSTPVMAGETPAAETVAFAPPLDFNVDLRVSGAIFGIELLSPSPAFKAVVARHR